MPRQLYLRTIFVALTLVQATGLRATLPEDLEGFIQILRKLNDGDCKKAIHIGKVIRGIPEEHLAYAFAYCAALEHKTAAALASQSVESNLPKPLKRRIETRKGKAALQMAELGLPKLVEGRIQTLYTQKGNCKKAISVGKMTRQIPEEHLAAAAAFCADLEAKKEGNAVSQKAESGLPKLVEGRIQTLYTQKGNCKKAISVGKMTRQIPEEYMSAAAAYCESLTEAGSDPSQQHGMKTREPALPAASGSELDAKLAAKGGLAKLLEAIPPFCAKSIRDFLGIEPPPLTYTLDDIKTEEAGMMIKITEINKILEAKAAKIKEIDDAVEAGKIGAVKSNTKKMAEEERASAKTKDLKREVAEINQECARRRLELFDRIKPKAKLLPTEVTKALTEAAKDSAVKQSLVRCCDPFKPKMLKKNEEQKFAVVFDRLLKAWLEQRIPDVINFISPWNYQPLFDQLFSEAVASGRPDTPLRKLGIGNLVGYRNDAYAAWLQAPSEKPPDGKSTDSRRIPGKNPLEFGLDEKIVASRTTEVKKKPCPEACANGKWCCAELPVGTPSYKVKSYLGQCTSKRPFIGAGCKDADGNIPTFR